MECHHFIDFVFFKTGVSSTECLRTIFNYLWFRFNISSHVFGAKRHT